MRYLGELEVVDVVAQAVRHGGDEGAFAGAGRAVEEVASLPCAADALEVGFALHVGLEVGHEAVLGVGIHGECVEGGGVVKRVRPPALVVAAVEVEVSQLGLVLFGAARYVVHVGRLDEVFVCFQHLEDVLVLVSLAAVLALGLLG